VPDGTDFVNLITAIQEAAQDHEHKAAGGSGSGTGDAGQVGYPGGMSGMWLDGALSPTILTGGALSSGSTPGTFKTTALTCLLRITNEEDGVLMPFTLAEQDDQAITAADTTYFVILTYDGDATPALSHSATHPTDYRSIVIGKVMKTSAPETHVLETGVRLLSGIQHLSRRAKELRAIELAAGCGMAWNDDVADNEFTIEAGIVYQGITRITPFSAAAFNSNDDDFVYMWRDTDVWQYTTGSKVISALYFDDNTADGGHPGGTLANGRYGVAWVYIHPSDEHVYVVYGRDSYKLAEAELAQAPGDIPSILSDFGLLIGRIIIVKSGTTFEQIDSVIDTYFTGTAVADHNQLGNLTTGDFHTQYSLRDLPVLTGDGQYAGHTEDGIAGETLVFGEPCYLVAATSKWKLTKGDAVATSGVKIGVCVLAAAADTDATRILTWGKVRAALFPAFTVGAPAYLDAANAGRVVVAAPSGTEDFVVRAIGEASTAEDLMVDPDRLYVVLNGT